MVPPSSGSGTGGPKDGASPSAEWGEAVGVPRMVTLRPGSGGNPACSACNAPLHSRPWDGCWGRGMWTWGGGPPAHLLATGLLATPPVAWQQSVQDVWLSRSREMGGAGGHQWDCSTQCPSPSTPHHPLGLSHPLPREAPPAHSSGHWDECGPSSAWRVVPQSGGCCEPPKNPWPWGHNGDTLTGSMLVLSTLGL